MENYDNNNISYIPLIKQNGITLNIRGYTDIIPQGDQYFTTSFPEDGVCGLSHLINLEKKIGVKNLERVISQKKFSQITKQDYKFTPVNSDKAQLCIGIALYNEPPEELRRVLVSLADRVVEMKDSVDCQVILVSDGHTQMHPKTRIYLKALLCQNEMEEIAFDNFSQSLDEYCYEKKLSEEDERNGVSVDLRRSIPPPLIYVLQKCKDGIRLPVRIRGGKDRNNERYLNLIWLCKSLNKRKHNSQEWMFNFAEYGQQKAGNFSPADFIFLTDCGTLYEKDCLLKLVTYMRTHPKCVGCTGRQRVMTKEEQDCEDESFTEKFLRAVQLADYEASYAIYTGAFSLLGCLPVLPGPCCMLRYSALKANRYFSAEDPLDEIILGKNFSQKDSPNRSDEALLEESNNDSSGSYDIENGLTSIELESIKKHKESVLDYFKNLVGIGPEKTNIVIENLKLAEDRIPSCGVITHGQSGDYTTWVDGAVFKFQAETSLDFFAQQRRRWINGAFFSYVWLVFSHPHLIGKSSHFFLRRFLILFLFLLQLFTYLLAAVSPAIFASSFYLGLISLFSIDSQIPILIATLLFSTYIYFFMWVHHFQKFVKPLFYFMVLLNIVVMVFSISGYIRQVILWKFMPPETAQAIIQWSVLIILFSPFFMALLSLDFLSAWYLVKSCIPYWLFLPTLIGSFTIYSFSRLFDTTWGNRTSLVSSSFKSSTQKQISDLQGDLKSNSLIALIFLTAVNITLQGITMYFGLNTWFIISILSVVFFTTFVQIFFSTIYFLGKHLSGLTFWQRYSLCSCYSDRNY